MYYRRKATSRNSDTGCGKGPPLAVAVITALLAVTAVAPAQEYVKWDQPPDPSVMSNVYYGWNEYTEYGDFGGQIAADDWYCDTADPVSDIHWWGSFIGWNETTPPNLPQAFHFAIWSDAPAGGIDEFSHPGVVIWEYWCNDYTWEFVGWDFDPQTEQMEACFLFHCDLPENNWFYQTFGENIYWLSIAPTYQFPPEYPFGWKTRPRDALSPAPDAAVRIFDPTMPTIGSAWGFGQPIRWPSDDPVDDWDLAFYLTTMTASGLKWDQPPRLNPQSPYPDCYWGWDEVSDYWGYAGPIIADDWVCLDDQPVTDVHWWGSYWNWYEPFPPDSPMGFHIGIWTDVPAGVDEDFSHPGEMIWEWYAPLGEYTEDWVGCDFHSDWMEEPESCFYYTYVIPPGQWFYQPGDGEIYWISIAADYGYPPEYVWGWKTRERDPTSLAPDDAVRIFDPTAPFIGSIWGAGEPIWWPEPDASWDTAFQLTTTGVESIKWYQPPEPYISDNVYNGWDEFSVYGDMQIAADDWVCENDDPITDVHWWGSFIGWGQTTPPQMPNRFHICIWTDVPAGVDQTFSHPGDMIWEYYCDDFTWNFDGWDIDPRDPWAMPEACFYFECDLPEWAWFYQEPGDNIYWVSISGVYGNGVLTDYPFGWKTRPRDPASPAPDDAVRIFDPTAPIPGDVYINGQPIFWPSEPDSWDLAFQLTATHEGPQYLEPKWDQPPHDPETAFDAVSNLWWPDTEPPGLVDVVVADDFISDGRDILALTWWGSYFDERYAPDYLSAEPYVLDGWLLGIHWAKEDIPGCPPDLLLDPPPTVLAVYFAPANAVTILGVDMMDCLGHAVYYYEVDLDACCLVCTHPDPRNNFPPPGLPGVFQERADTRYWLSVQAVTGIEWLPPDCEPVFTGHIPPLDNDPFGQFWGWLNGYEPPVGAPLDEACVGRIVDFTPYPPDCWDYGNWVKQPWMCPTQPELVNMAFSLLASDCPEDLVPDRVIDLADLAQLLSVFNSCYGDANYLPAADFNNDGCVGLSDLAQLLSVFNTNCP